MTDDIIPIRADVRLVDLVDTIFDECDFEEIQQFILQIDERVCDFDFTIDLVCKLLSALSEDCDPKKIDRIQKSVRRLQDE